MIELRMLTKCFNGAPVVDAVSLTVEKGTIAVVVGPSGSGKSTLLRMINRLVEPTSGSVWIDGRDTMTFRGHELRRHIGYVIQGYGLFPHRTVAQNIATAPRLLGWTRRRTAARVEELMDAFQLDPARFADRRPHELSGGQQQRVGVARALAAEPAVLLMDEPFGALDPIIRSKAQDDLLAIQRRFGATVMLVTHDMEEAFHLGQRIAVLDSGRLCQFGPPEELLTRPADTIVERMVGDVDRPFRLLRLARIEAALEPGEAPGEPLSSGISLQDALSRMILTGTMVLPVISQDGRPLGRVSLAGILAFGRIAS
jgi:osmoprotectant transport system ATP-binding protein